MDATTGRTRGRRVAALIALAATVAAGLATRVAPVPGVAADVAGDALYAVAVYGALVILLPRTRPAAVATIAAGWSVAVELFQATGVPARLASDVPPVALVLGTGFDPRDLLVYPAAAVVTAVIDEAIRRRLASSPARRGGRRRRDPATARDGGAIVMPPSDEGGRR
ncbi:DUF2809 domain-containing protein [Microbacterium sp. NPDC090007]|uniref:ribosomal maturation YjgA family protein n=1 Tax=Microbacterium sp. NPDC090007 TaxID=3364204 RepID=UPI0037F89E9A